MRRVVLALTLGLILAGIAGTAWAFDPPDTMGRFQEDLKKTRLGPALGVDQNKVEQLLAIDQKYKPLKDQARRDAMAAYMKLQQVMRSPNPTDDQVKVILETMRRKQQESLDLQQRQLEEEIAILTPVQQAKYLMFLMSLRRQMVKEVRSLGPLNNGGVGARPAGATAPRQMPAARSGAPPSNPPAAAPAPPSY
jgi:hypothetical protein